MSGNSANFSQLIDSITAGGSQAHSAAKILKKEISFIGAENHRLEETVDGLRSALRDARDSLSAREKELSELQHRLAEEHSVFEAWRGQQRAEIEYERKELRKKQRDFEDQIIAIEDETQANLAKNTTDFVEVTQQSLRLEEKSTNRIATFWALAGAAILLVGLYYLVDTYAEIQKIFFETTTDVADTLIQPKSLDWPTVVFFSAKGAILISALGIFARYAFIMYREGRDQNKIAKDRGHGIRFGQLYLKTFGKIANWDQLQEAFSYWHATSSETDTKQADLTAEHADSIVKGLNEISKNITSMAK